MGILPFTFRVKLFWTFSWIALPLYTLKFRTEVIFWKHFSTCFFCSILKLLVMVRSAKMTGLDLNPLALNSNGPEKWNMHSKSTSLKMRETKGYFVFLWRGYLKNPQPSVMPPWLWLERNGHCLCMLSSGFFERIPRCQFCGGHEGADF